MKRYTAEEIRDLYYTLPDDAAFYSCADLIAAGVLVPVPDGEAMDIDEVDDRQEPLLIHDGHLYYNAIDDLPLIALEDGVQDLRREGATDLTPVRLVKLEDVG